MIEPTHKMLNGVAVALTDEEVAACKKQWIADTEKKLRQSTLKEERKVKRANLLRKLKITEEEADLLRGQI